MEKKCNEKEKSRRKQLRSIRKGFLDKDEEEESLCMVQENFSLYLLFIYFNRFFIVFLYFYLKCLMFFFV